MHHHKLFCLGLAATLTIAASARAQPDTDAATTQPKPVKVYILAGQSNMVGIGQVTSGGTRWGGEFIDPVVSVYRGAYDPDTDYDKIEPIKTQALEAFGGVHPTAYPGGGTQIVRGSIAMPETGVYEFRPGYGGSMQNVMTIDGKEVHRQEPGKEAKRTPIKLEAGKKVSFNIVYLTNEANGLGWYVRLDVPGTLRTAAVEQGKFPELIDSEGNWVSRDDVWYKGVVTATANKWLSVGCGAGGGQIGPELGFGWVLGDYHEEPVLMIKASQGNRSLGWDFLPPGSERIERDGYIYAGYKDSPARWEKGTKPEPIEWYAGKQYDDCFKATHEVLNNFDKNFPQWKDRGYEIAGFVWWQGHKDSGSEVYQERYEKNLVQLIETLRKEFNAPKAPFVVGTVGFHGWDLPDQFKPIADAQLAVSDNQKYPPFKGNVKSVETRDFWLSPDKSPKNQDYHYNQNGETYYRIGKAFGQGMVELLKAGQ